MADDPPKDLVRAVAYGSAVFVVGAGISRAAAKTPLWSDFLTTCIQFLADQGAHVPALDCVPCLLAANEYEIAAQVIQKSLDRIGGAAQLLHEQFHRQGTQIESPAVLDALWRLNHHLQLTTNYDRLLEMRGPAGVETVTWQEPMKMWSALKAHPVATGVPAVIHMHGVYNDPHTVVYSVSDYTTLNQEPSYLAFAQSLWTNYTLVFVGASPFGIGDMDFSRLFEWGRRVAPFQAFPSYTLQRSGSVANEQRETLYREYKVRVVEYGDFAELASYLVRLRSEADQLIQTTTGAIPQLGPLALYQLVTKLVAIRSINDGAVRQGLVSRLPKNIQDQITSRDPSTPADLDIANILGASMTDAVGLRTFVDLVREAEGDTGERHGLDEALGQLFPGLTF